MHNLNLFNMRVQLLVGRPLWTEFNTLASEKNNARKTRQMGDPASQWSGRGIFAANLEKGIVQCS